MIPPPTATDAVRGQFKACEDAKKNKRLGKYFCFIKNMAGIQYPLKEKTKYSDPDMNAQPFIGKIRPNEDKFFMEISRNKLADVCKEGSETRKFCDDDTIQEKFEIRSKSKDVLAYGQSSDSYAFHHLDGAFVLYGTSEFKSFMTFGSSYVTEGRCEKID